MIPRQYKYCVLKVQLIISYCAKHTNTFLFQCSAILIFSHFLATRAPCSLIAGYLAEIRLDDAVART